jgi:hypothetical protein
MAAQSSVKRNRIRGFISGFSREFVAEEAVLLAAPNLSALLRLEFFFWGLFSGGDGWRTRFLV